jgi:lipid-binding SYLF domain-containing protein
MYVKKLILTMCVLLIALGFAPTGHAATNEDLTHEADQMLTRLIDNNPAASGIYSKSHAVLIFPNMVKAGLIFGGAYGEGVLKQYDAVQGYYNSITASFGWQLGAQSYGYVVFLMNEKAVDFVRKTRGWEIGVGPSVVVVTSGLAKNLSTTSLQKDAYAFIIDQKGIMAALSIEGTKITRIRD